MLIVRSFERPFESRFSRTISKALAPELLWSRDFTDILPETVEAPCHRSIQGFLGAVYIQAVLFRNEGKIDPTDVIQSPQERTVVQARCRQLSQHRTNRVEERFAPVDLDSLYREVVSKKAYPPEGVTG